MKTDCVYYTLHLSSYGYVVFCKNCNNYQVAFGNVMIKISEDEYMEFKNEVVHSKTKFFHFKNTNEEHVKNIVISIYYYGVSLVLNYLEVEKLHEILLAADNKKMILNMLDYSKN